jgi:site-specific DNA-methyltransferase (adenine-specific)
MRQPLSNTDSPSAKVTQGDCVDILQQLAALSVDVAYLDPPFLTNRHHSAASRDRTARYSFPDAWKNEEAYLEFMIPRLRQVHRVLKTTGSIFVHCDTNANHLLRSALDSVFGPKHFRSEIVWAYRRWSNSAKGLLAAHQTILFYSKTSTFKFNKVFTPYSETTNVDQILQQRTRDKDRVSTYATDEIGQVVLGKEKKGVPLSDVWMIPYLNPKARERTGYPTQKPILLLERIISIASDPGDLILDPFCGSGTTLIAASMLGRRSVGIDCSREAVDLTLRRLRAPIRTESAVMVKGRGFYLNENQEALAVLSGLDVVPVQRNSGIDAFLQSKIDDSFIPIRVQRQNESLVDAASKLALAAKSRRAVRALLVQTHSEKSLFSSVSIPEIVDVVDSAAFAISKRITSLLDELSKDCGVGVNINRVRQERAPKLGSLAKGVQP